MNPDLALHVLSLPGAQRFIDKILQTLQDGISIILVYPDDQVGNSLEEALIKSLNGNKSFLESELLDLCTNPRQEPFLFLKDAFSDMDQCGYLEKVVEERSLPDVMILKGIRICPPDIQDKWIQTMVRWAEACRSSGGVKTMILMLPADIATKKKLPPSDIRLVYQIWAGLPSALEVRLLCRLQADEINAEGLWREFLLSSLAGNDIGLCEWLWDDVFSSPDRIVKSIAGYANEQGWTPDSVNGWMNSWKPKPAGLDFWLMPTDKNFYHLCQKMTLYTPEYGEEMNPAILAVNGKANGIDHRIWRAQAALILPMIDDVRRKICDLMTAGHGDGWAVINGEVFSPPLELGNLKVVFDTLDITSVERKEWREDVCHTWKLRNLLAHYETVSFADFEKFWKLYIKVQRLS